MVAENPMRFSTKYFVDKLGIGDWGYRWYIPPLGRWASQDPLGEKAFILLNKTMISAIRMNNFRSPNGELSPLNLNQAFHNNPLNRREGSVLQISNNVIDPPCIAL